MSPLDLHAARLRLGWSQQRLAETLGVARNTVARWEMGRHPIPAMAAHLLAHYLDEAI